MEGLNYLWETSAFSDLVIICGDKQWKVHKSVIGASSGYFRTLCLSPDWKEAREGVIKLEHVEAPTDKDAGGARANEDFSSDHPNMVGSMLAFIYTGKILSDEQFLALERNDKKELQRTFWTKQRPTELYLSRYARMYALACKYDVVTLRDKALAGFKHNMSKDLSYQDLAAALRISFNTGSEKECQMRDCVFGLLLEHIRGLSEYRWARDAIEGVPGLSMRLITTMATKW
ncbi:uncharacterized protein K489DRAFT_248080 [Dissoconium aciculare CBS 342.82]|uniref:BTB domain-containing protein n=1 Tax=Dissoconium aciculare CBS 342.82 TaxID=1314786 RepID=A0A6J3M1Q9_9PEZI|nr:uncharacterized protein K489DRAFT_248080 [Dissoconium aciculare CBS 342.82]KAF1821439.1 hypothetical protein K489DRAFT_248080 [Dissoconium aciculare CBS 342.82]